jgi:signal transduction histidine kinase
MAEVSAKLGIFQQGLAKVGAEVELLSARGSQQGDTEPRPLRLPELAGEQLAFWRGDMFFKHEADLSQEMAPARRRTLAAYADLALAFNALVANALEALQASGKRRLWVSYAEQEGEVRLEVGDEGPGPDPEMTPVMFEPFTGHKGAGHCGLGLFLAAQAVAPWGGRLAWTAQPRNTFSLILPALAS